MVWLEALVCWIDDLGDRLEAPAVVKDVSGRGFGVELSWRLPLGTRVELKALDSSIPCIVRHVRRNEDNIHMGLEIRSEDELRPEQSLLRLSDALSAARAARRTIPPHYSDTGEPKDPEDQHVERRQHERHSAEFNVLVHWRDSSGVLRNQSGVVQNTSSHGFGIVVERELTEGEPLSIETSNGSLQCIVRNSNKCDGGWFLNVELMLASDSRDHRRQLAKLAAISDETHALRNHDHEGFRPKGGCS